MGVPVWAELVAPYADFGEGPVSNLHPCPSTIGGSSSSDAPQSTPDQNQPTVGATPSKHPVLFS